MSGYQTESRTKEKEIMETQMTTRQSGVPAVPDMAGAWGTEGTNAQNILIPKLLLKQPISEEVIAGDMPAGCIVKSTTLEEVMPKGGSLDFIPLSTFDTWVISEKIGDKFEFRRIEPVTPENINAQWSWDENGTTWRRDYNINYYVLLPDEIERELKAFESDDPDPDDALVPCVISFQRTSIKAGKQIATYFGKCARFGRPAASKVLTLSTEMTKNDKGTFFVFNVKTQGCAKTTPDQLEAAAKWYQTIRSSSNIKVHEEEEAASEPAASKPVDVSGEDMDF